MDVGTHGKSVWFDWSKNRNTSGLGLFLYLEFFTPIRRKSKSEKLG